MFPSDVWLTSHILRTTTPMTPASPQFTKFHCKQTQNSDGAPSVKPIILPPPLSVLQLRTTETKPNTNPNPNRNPSYPATEP